jgi:hypothetical protein
MRMRMVLDMRYGTAHQKSTTSPEPSARPICLSFYVGRPIPGSVESLRPATPGLALVAHAMFSTLGHLTVQRI